jgi:hypothetical protein
MPSSARVASRATSDARTASIATPWTIVSVRARYGRQTECSTCSETAITASLSGSVTPFTTRVGRANVDQPLCSVATSAGRSDRGNDHATRRAIPPA